MELICRVCRKPFQNAENKKRAATYCPGCQKKIQMLRRQSREDERRAAKARHDVLNSGPAHKLNLDTVLRELDQFNALRRTEGHSVVSYGRYVAMRDGYIQIGEPAACRQSAVKQRIENPNGRIKTWQ